MRAMVVRVLLQWIAGRRHALACAAIPLMLCLPIAGHAADSGAAVATEAPVVLAQAMIPEVSARTMPRFDTTDGTAASTSRLDMTWLPPQRSALGFSLGMTSLDGFGPAATPFSNGAASMDLGLHWRYTIEGSHRFDVSAWRRMTPVDTLNLVESRQPTYGARVEMRLAGENRRGLVADRGFLGFQLESGARITLRRSGGRPMLYYRARF